MNIQVAKILLPLISMVAIASSGGAAGTHTWTWTNGDEAPNQYGIYGQLGVAAVTNKPGARRKAGSWTDLAGNLWLFGGYGYGNNDLYLSYLNDLWKYDVSSGFWIWIKGSNMTSAHGTYGTKGTGAPENTPGARAGAVTWSDSGGDFWLFGGVVSGTYTFHRNDLWKFDATGQGNWTWVSGSSIQNQHGIYGSMGVPSPGNEPGSRQGAISWNDLDGNLWLLGGYGYGESGALGRLNDLWKFNLATGNWIWVKGSKGVDHAGTYGSLGVAGEANTPGARYNAISWTDASGTLWMFGGIGYGILVGETRLNDLWKFNTVSSQWTWMKGSNVGNRPATGQLGETSATNNPGSRDGAVSTIDTMGNLCLFSGYGYGTTAGTLGYLDDSWIYNIANNTWTWVDGSGSLDQPGQYGSKGVTSPANIPPARHEAVSWSDSDGNRWVFGGHGVSSTGAEVRYNDLWKAAYHEDSGIKWEDISLY